MMKNKKFKKVIVMLLVLLMVFNCLISCSKEEQTPKEETVTTKEKDETNSRVEEKEESAVQEESEEVEEVSAETKKDSETKIESNTSKKTTTTSANITSSNGGHTHNWVKSVTTVHHEAEGQYQVVCVGEAYTKEIPVYETVAWEMCTTCGADISDNHYEHMREHMLKGENGNRCTQYKDVQVGTTTIDVPPQYEKQWVETKPAWDEEVVTYTCSCGATK